MPRSLSVAAQAEIAKNNCIEPLIIVEVLWGPTQIARSYSERDLADGSEGKILELDGLDTLAKIGDVGGSSGSVSITLDDCDQTIKGFLDSQDIHKSVVNIYQAFDDIALTEKFLLFTGEINSPIRYSNSQKTISFTILSRVEDQQIGFAPEESDLNEIQFVSPSAIGKAWPLCFGQPIQVPAVKLTERIRGTSLTRYGLITIQELDDICSRAEALTQAELNKEAADSNPGFSDENYEVVANNLLQAAEALYLLAESLLAGDETARTQLYQLIDNCALRYRTRLLFLQQESLATSFQASADANQAAITSLDIQIINAQNAIPPAVDLLSDGPNGPGLITRRQQQQAEFNSNTTAAALANGLAVIFSNQIAGYNATIDILIDSLCNFRISEIIIDGGENFPQGVTTSIVVNGVRFQGTFSGRTFSILQSNLPIDYGITIGQSPEDNQFAVVNQAVNLKGKYCYLPGKGVIIVNEQDASIGTFSPLLMRQTGALPPLPNVTLNGQPIIREIYDIRDVNGVIAETAGVIRKVWIDQLSNIPDFADGLGNIPNRDYNIEIGDEVYLYADYKDIYVANLIPSTEVFEVYAYRRVDGGERRLLPVPSRYYTVNLSDSIAGQSPTTITFPRPITEFVDENWEEDIYVSVTSTEGPNTADVIEYLLTNYSNLTPEASSFASVSAAIAAYPSNFALLEKADALNTIENIAWQARCTVLVAGLEAKIKYLAAEEAPIHTFNFDNVEWTTLELDYGNTEDLVTKLIGKWRTKYSQEEDFRVVLQNNIARYGLFEQEYEIYIYNSESFVVKALTYWMIRYSNTWKRVQFNGFLDALEVELQDTVTLDFTNDFIASSPVLGRVLAATYDSDNNQITFEVESEVRSGEMAEYVFAYPATAPPAEIYPTINDPNAGT